MRWRDPAHRGHGRAVAISCKLAGMRAEEPVPAIAATRAERVLFCGIFVLVACWFHFVDVRTVHFSAPSSLYIADILCRLLFILYYACIMHSAGELVLGASFNVDHGLGRVESFLASSFTGAAVVNVAMFALGLAKLWQTPVLISGAAILLWTGYGGAKRLAMGLVSSRLKCSEAQGGPVGMTVTVSLGAVILLQLAYVLVMKGLFPDADPYGDAMGTYFPYFEEIKRTHSIWVNKHYIHFFLSKGNGFHVLSSVLADVFCAQLVSFYFFGLSAAVLFQFVKKALEPGHPAIWPLSAAVLYLASDVTRTEFAKAHMLMGSFYAYFVYTASRLVASSPRPGAWERLQIFSLAALTLLSPITLAFTTPVLFFQSTMSFLSKERRPMARRSLVSAAAFVAFAAAILCFNYFTFGLWEFTPPRFFILHGNTGIARKWVDPLSLLFQSETHVLMKDGVFSLAQGLPFADMRWPAAVGRALFDPAMVPFLAVAFILCHFSLRAPRDYSRRIVPASLTAAFGCLLPLLLGLAVSQGSLHRFSVSFLPFLKAAVYVLAWACLAQRIGLAFRFLKPATLGFAACATVVFLALLRFADSLPGDPVAKGAMDAFGFLRGKTSYAEIYAARAPYVRDCLEIQKIIGHDKKVLTINCLPLAYGLPRSAFQHPLMCDFNKGDSFREVMFGSHDAAQSALRSSGIDYFMVDLRQELLYYAFTPLFSITNVEEHFKVVWSSNSSYLLSWKSDGDRTDEHFLAEYSAAKKRDKAALYARVYANLLRYMPPRGVLRSA